MFLFPKLNLCSEKEGKFTVYTLKAARLEKTCGIVFDGRKPGKVDNVGDVTGSNEAPIFGGMAPTFEKCWRKHF